MSKSIESLGSYVYLHSLLSVVLHTYIFAYNCSQISKELVGYQTTYYKQLCRICCRPFLLWHEVFRVHVAMIETESL